MSNLQRQTELRADPEKARAWRQRGAERYAERVRERGGRKPLERRSELAPMSKRKLDELASRGETAPASTMPARTAQQRRDHDVATRAERDDWHLYVCRSRWCVKGCGRRAGPHGHHAIEKQHLLSHPLLAGHSWDFALGVAVCKPCHSRHTTRVDPITRTELIAAGYWQTLVDWARMLDARYFVAGHEPVLSRLEREYP